MLQREVNNYDIHGVGDHYQPSILLASVLQTIQRYDALLVQSESSVISYPGIVQGCKCRRRATG